MTDISEIRSLLQPHGLVILGVLDVANSAEDFPVFEQQAKSQVVLVGNAGSSIWPIFASSQEYGDGLPNPLDRLSKRIGTDVAAALNAEAVFPFEGPPYPPVLDWAGNAGQAHPSPVSMFIHGKYGLWHAYRFVLLLRKRLAGFRPRVHSVSPCLSCKTQPCLSACPVDAFSDDKYIVDDCVAYLAGDQHSDCRQHGCRARRACPVGVEYQYEPVHARFHMDAFLDSQDQSKT